VVAKNLPGSEFFSSALREGVNGTLVSNGKFQFRNSGTIEDITLVFNDGRIVDFDARVGKEALAKIIDADKDKGEGSRYLGELGIGTNPHLRRHLINALLVEKVSGSFHLAIGACYTYTSYEGEPVKIQNGNSSANGVHWDITTLLRGNGGHIELMYDTDGGEVKESVQQNGNWLVKGTEVLNDGWEALPADQRPAWWTGPYQN
jgi:aminopeptidase